MTTTLLDVINVVMETMLTVIPCTAIISYLLIPENCQTWKEKKKKKITLSVGIQCKIGDSRGTDDMPLGSDSENTVGYMHETLS